MRKHKFLFFYAGALFLPICLGIAHLISMEHDLPQIRLLSPAASAVITTDTEIELELSDATSGLRSARADLLLDGERIALLHEDYADKPLTRRLRLKINPSAPAGPDGQAAAINPPGHDGRQAVIVPPAQEDRQTAIAPSERNDLRVCLEVRVRDNSTADWWRGNSAVFQADFLLDRAPPEATVLALSGKIRQGGSAALVFRASEPLRSARVEAGGRQFKAYAQTKDLYACLFAFPYRTPLNDYHPELVLEDQAGLVTRQPLRPLGLEAAASVFRPDAINLSKKFLAGKAEEFARLVPAESASGPSPSGENTTGRLGPAAGSGENAALADGPAYAASDASELLELFLIVNSEVRAQNYARLAEYREDTAPVPLWRGAFLRLPRSVQLSEFADRRSYIYQGGEVDRRTHQGIDLASISRDRIPAAGNGRVLAAGYLGIHGNMALIDHGLGLQSLYSHLSEIQVTPGENVEKGRIIGLTGTSGMAGGDHLHFEFLLSGLPVIPDEWLDPAWSGRIESILLEARP